MGRTDHAADGALVRTRERAKPRFLDSPRRRRRLTIAAAVIVMAAPLISLGVHYSSPGSSGNAEGPYINNDAFYRQPKHVPFTARERQAVRGVLRGFIRSAVARHDVAASWDLAGPSLRSGVTRRQWATGAIPVVPYPAAKHGLGMWDSVKYSYR